MPVQYTCPECKTRMQLAEAARPGDQVECPECAAVFAPVARAAAAKPAAARPAAARPAAAPVPAAPPPAPAAAPPVDEYDDLRPYGVAEESEEEKKLAEANKPKFDEVRDKFKKSARGPAMSLLVLPSNLLVAEGGLTALVGIGAIVVGGWPLLFSDAPPSDEELVDNLTNIFIGFFAVIYGCLICYGAAQMQNLNSYAWGVVAGVLGILPLLAGIFTLVTLRDPRVIAGFKEVEGSAIGVKKDEDDKKDDDDDEEEEKPKKKRKR